MDKILIYDFDGTLTPFPVPKYEILEKYGYNSEKLMNEIKLSENNGLDKYESLYDAYFRILNRNNCDLNNSNFILGANRVKYNKGVSEFLKAIPFKHYLISSGIKIYLENLVIAKYFTQIYGTTFKYINGLAIGVDRIVNGIEKINCIKDIITDNPNSLIIYLGDGLTDEEAFRYVKSINGISIFIINNNIDTYNYFKEKNIIDDGFEADFTVNGKIYEYVKQK